MKKLQINAVLGLFMAIFLAYAQPSFAKKNNTTLPNGRPFQILQSEIDLLQAQIDQLIGRVSTLEAWQVQAQAALTQLQTDTAANAAAIALLQGQMADVQAILATKQDIISGQCPAGQYVYSISGSTLICRVDSGTPVLYTVFTYKNIAPNTTAIVTAACPSGSTVTGGSSQSANLQINSDALDSVNNGWTVNATNLTTGLLPVIVTATCSG